MNDLPDNKKQIIEKSLMSAYEMICELRNSSLTGNLDIKRINDVEDFFIKNKREYEKVESSNKYLLKFYALIEKFWSSYRYWPRQKSKGEFILFNSLRSKDYSLKEKGYSDEECAKVLRSMEESWVSLNQVYTQYSINLIKKKFQR